MKRPAALVAYRALSDVAGKGAFFLVTVVAARRLSGEAFGVFALGSTIGWMAAVAADFGIQLHLARQVAQHPGTAERILRRWFRVRLWTAAAALGFVAVLVVTTGLAGPYAAALILLSLAYCVNGLIEFLHYFYRGLSRTDVESTLTLCQRGVTLVVSVAALWWWPDLNVLALALVVPAIATFAYSARLATRLGRATGAAAMPAAPNVAAEFTSDVMPIGAGIVLAALYFRIDVP